MTISSSFWLDNPVARTFFSYFPNYRTEYREVVKLNGLFKRMESIAFASFPSLRKTTANAELQAERVKIIGNIQHSQVSEKTIEGWLKTAASTIDAAKRKFLYAHEKKQIDRLEQQHLALQYRSGALTKGYDRASGEALARQVEPLIRTYISHPKIFPGRHRRSPSGELAELTPKERERLVHACTRYPELFRKFLERHEKGKEIFDDWTAGFVKWCIRSGCSVGVFVKLPLEREALSKIHIDKRSGSVDGKKGIRFCDIGVFGCFQRVLCMKMDNEMQPIQGDFKNHSVTLKNLINPTAAGLTLRVRDIFKALGEKTHSYGNIDYLQGGIRNWNSIKLGSYNSRTKQLDTVATDSVLRELKTKAPLVSLSAEDLQERYSLSERPSLAKGQWALTLRASRLKPNRNILEAHGYTEVIFRENDQYYVFPMGVQALDLPSKDLERLSYLTSTNPAGLHYPDESFFLTQRQHLGLFFPLSKEEEVRLHYAISRMYKEGKEGRLLFQFGGTNCSYHIQQLFDTVVAAPLYDKIQDIADKAFSKGNYFTEALDRMNFKRAFEGLNHDLLDQTLDKLMNYLWGEKNTADIQQLAELCKYVLSKTYGRQVNFDSSKLSSTNPEQKKLLKSLVFETIETIRFYRMDLFTVETDQSLLSSLNSAIQMLPWRWTKQVFINIVLFLFGSWRWVAVRKEAQPQEAGSGRLEISAMAANPLIQEGYLNHPAALWEWIKHKEGRFAKLTTLLTSLQTS